MMTEILGTPPAWFNYLIMAVRYGYCLVPYLLFNIEEYISA